MGQYSKKHSVEAWRKRLRVELADTLYEQSKREQAALIWEKYRTQCSDTTLHERLQKRNAEEELYEHQVSASEAGKCAEELAQWTVAACLAAVFALVALMALLDQAGGPL